MLKNPTGEGHAILPRYFWVLEILSLTGFLFLPETVKIRFRPSQGIFQNRPQPACYDGDIDTGHSQLQKHYDNG